MSCARMSCATGSALSKADESVDALGLSRSIEPLFKRRGPNYLAGKSCPQDRLPRGLRRDAKPAKPSEPLAYTSGLNTAASQFTSTGRKCRSSV